MEELAIALRILKRGWWIILSTVILAVAITSWINERSISTYQTNLRMFVNADMIALEGRDLIYGYSELNQASIVTTFVEVANSRHIREDAAAKFNQPTVFFDQYTASTVVLPDSTVLELVVTGPSPQVVKYFADAIGESVVEFVRGNYSAYKLEILDSAYLPSEPIKPNRGQNLAVSLILGAILGVVLAVVADLLPNPMDTIRSWRSLDRPTRTLKRNYFDRHVDDWLYSEGVNTNFAILRFTNLPQLEETLTSSRFKQLLKEIMKILREELRGKDVICRWSNDSFAILMPGVYSAQASDTLELIVKKLAGFVFFESLEPGPLTPIVGAVMLSERMPYASLIDQVEAALEKASNNSSQRIVFIPESPIQKEFSPV
jgi:capsular polysaccharide biosynthesis protein